jgi:mRNA interferase MazF
MEKDFDGWNREKKIVDRKEIKRSLFFHEKEVWWCSTGINVGVEVYGKNHNFERPMLILKKFNRDMFWALPLTTKDKIDLFHYKINRSSVSSSVVISQIKTMSSKRLLRKLGALSDIDFDSISLIIGNML